MTWLWQPLALGGAQQLTSPATSAPQPVYPREALRGRPALAHTFQAWAGRSFVYPPAPPPVAPERPLGRPALAHEMQVWAGPAFVYPLVRPPIAPERVLGPAAAAHQFQAWAGPPWIPPALPPSVWPDAPIGRAARAHTLLAWSGPGASGATPPPPVVIFVPKFIVQAHDAIDAVAVENAIAVIRTEVDMAEPFRQGALHRPYRALAFTAAGFVNLPTEFPGGITFRMVLGSTVISGPATGDANGNLTYQWQPGDLDVPGIYKAYFIGTDAAGKTETMPDGHELEVPVVPTI